MQKLGVAVAAAGFAVLCTVGSASAAASTSTVIVDPSNFSTVYTPAGQTSTPASSMQFVNGPATPPLGAGSLELTTTNAAGHQQYLEGADANTPLAAISQLGYSTYRHSTSTGTAGVEVAINMAIFTNSTGPNTGFATLVFEPYLNPGLGAVVNDTWQTWDAYDGGNGLWHATKAIGSITAGTAATWSAFLVQAPAATVIGYGPNLGSNNAGIDSNVDALSIGTAATATMYDYELAPPVNTPEAPATVLLLGLAIPAGAVFLLASRRRRLRTEA